MSKTLPVAVQVYGLRDTSGKYTREFQRGYAEGKRNRI